VNGTLAVAQGGHEGRPSADDDEDGTGPVTFGPTSRLKK
jgi:hypothetical protein